MVSTAQTDEAIRSQHRGDLNMTDPSGLIGVTGYETIDQVYLEEILENDGSFDPSAAMQEVLHRVDPELGQNGRVVRVINVGSPSGRHIVEFDTEKSMLYGKMSQPAKLGGNRKSTWLARTYSAANGTNPTTVISYQPNGVWTLGVGNREELFSNKIRMGQDCEGIISNIGSFMQDFIFNKSLARYVGMEPMAHGLRLEKGDARRRLEQDIIALHRHTYSEAASGDLETRDAIRYMLNSITPNNLLFPDTGVTMDLRDLKLGHMQKWSARHMTGSRVLVFDVGPDVFGTNFYELAQSSEIFKQHLEAYKLGDGVPEETKRLINSHEPNMSTVMDSCYLSGLSALAELLFSAVNDPEVDFDNFVRPMYDEVRGAAVNHKLFGSDLLALSSHKDKNKLTTEIHQFFDYGMFRGAVISTIYSGRSKLNTAKAALDAMNKGTSFYLPTRA